MKVLPILFNTDMVRAILKDKKTVTRRVVKPQPKMRLAYRCMGHGCGKWSYPSEYAHQYWGDEWKRPDGITIEDENMLWSPPCHTDDILYVRETWNGDWCDHYIYKADGGSAIAAGYAKEPRWRPSIHMPKEAARIFLQVTGVQVERLQDITGDDVCNEGAYPLIRCQHEHPITDSDGYYCDMCWNAKDYCKNCPELDGYGEWFGRLVWNSTIKPADRPLYGWEANPWVWVIAFERCEKPEGYEVNKP